MEFSPVKSASSKQVVGHIIEKIRQEDPSYWPYGVSVGHHDGGLFLVREASSKEPIGFTGWQRRNDGLKKVAYYSIGILPQHRKKGFAKEAVAILREKLAGEVDEFRAFIMPHNQASINLANKLDIPVELEKSANPVTKALTSRLARSLTGSAIGAGMGVGMYGTDGAWRDDPLATGVGVGANALLGTYVGRLPMGQPASMLKTMGALGTSAGLNASLHSNKALDGFNKTMGQVEFAADNMVKDLENVKRNETLAKVNEYVKGHIPQLVWGGLAASAAFPIASSIYNYSKAKRTNALNDLTDQLKAQEDAKTEEQRETETMQKEAMMKKLLAKLPALAGVGGGIAAGHGVNKYVYPEGEYSSQATALGEMSNLLFGAFGGGSLGAAMRKGLDPALKARYLAQGILGAPAAMSVGTLGSKVRDTFDKSLDVYSNSLPEVTRAAANLTDPLSGAAAIGKYVKDNKNWIVPAAWASHVIPLAIWGHSAYSKEKATEKMTDQFIDNQKRYLDANTPTGVRDEPHEEPTSEEMDKAASGPKVPLTKWQILSSLAGMVGNAGLWDYYVYGGKPLSEMTAERALGLGIGGVTGGFMGKHLKDRQFAHAGGHFLATPAERLITLAAKNQSNQIANSGLEKSLLERQVNSPSESRSTSIGDLVKNNPGTTALLAALGVGGLGYLGHRAVKALEKPQEIEINQQPSPGQLKITLPTRDPNDNETQVILPLDAASTVNLSKSLQDTIGRDARRKLRGGARERVRRRPPEPKAFEDHDEEAEDKVIHFDKAASMGRVADLLSKLPA